ncbi:14553_t:CDS:2, partial [Racocetra persica]
VQLKYGDFCEVQFVALSYKFLYRDLPNPGMYELDMVKLWDVMIKDNRDVDLAKWLEKFAVDMAVSTSTGLPAYSMFAYFNSLGYEYNHDHIQLQNGNNLRN